MPGSQEKLSVNVNVSYFQDTAGESFSLARSRGSTKIGVKSLWLPTFEHSEKSTDPCTMRSLALPALVSLSRLRRRHP